MDDRTRELQSSALTNRRRVLLWRYGLHDDASVSGYYNRHRWDGEHDNIPVSAYDNRYRQENFLQPDERETGYGQPYNSDDVLPEDASSTLFVEGVPSDCSRREVSHIFRHFFGYKEVRIVNKSREPKNQAEGEPTVNVVVLCFVDFDNPKCAATAMEALQGYRLDHNDRDSPSLKLQFAFPRNHRRRGGEGYGN